MVKKLHLQCRFLLSLCLLLAVFPVLAADIITRTDRTEIGVNESFTLTFEAQGGVDGEPDFTPLEDQFDIVNQTQSSSINIINGQTSHKQIWTLTLFPKHSGPLTIPEIAFGSDRSPELQIRVSRQKPQAAGAGEDIFLTVEATPENPYVQAQVVYTLRLYRAVNTVNASLSEPQLSSSDAVVEQLGSDSTYETDQAGRHYVVYERHYAIFPQSAGTLTIQPVRFDGVVQSYNRGFFDPFGGGGGKRVRLTSKGVDLTVRPAPAAFKGAYWLPAEDLRLSETWSPDPPAFKVGEAVTRNLSIVAVGLTAAQLPELQPRVPQNFKQYPDQPVLENKQHGDNMLGTRLDKLALIPTRPGRYTLPAIEIPWWNTRLNKMEIARLPARDIDVLPGSPANQTQGGTAAVPSTEAAGNQAGNLPENVGGDRETASPGVENGAGFWPWLCLVLVVGWAATGAGWWWSLASKRSRRRSETQPRPDRKAIESRLKAACADNDADRAKTALLDWARATLPENAGRSLGNLANHVDAGLGAEVMALNAFLYRRQPGQTWLGEALWQAFKNADRPENSGPKPGSPDVLQPLYKIQANSKTK